MSTIWKGSARVGHPPNDMKDVYAIKYFVSFMGNFKVHFANVNATRGLAPGLKAPPGYHFQCLSTQLLGGAAFLIAFVAVLTSLRIGARATLLRLKWGADDWAVIPAALFTIAHAIMVILQAKFGAIGRHTWDQTYTRLAFQLTAVLPGTLFFFVATGFQKLAVCLFLRRLMYTPFLHWFHRLILDLLLALIILYTIMAAILPLFLVGDSPRWYMDVLWAAQQPGLPKNRSVTINLALSIPHVVLDFLLLAFAANTIYTLRVSLKKKLRIMAMFSSGLGSAACSIARVVLDMKKSTDTYHVTVRIVQWMLADLALAMLVVNLPGLNPLFFKRHSDDKNVDKVTLAPLHSYTSSSTKKAASSTDNETSVSDMSDLVTKSR